MDIIKIIGIGFIAVIIIILIKQYRPEFAIYVSIGAGILIFSIIAGKLSGIIEVLKSFTNKTSINNEFLTLLIKITGIAILTEFAVSISNDCGESSIANKIDLGGKVLIIVISIPIITALLETILKVIP